MHKFCVKMCGAVSIFSLLSISNCLNVCLDSALECCEPRADGSKWLKFFNIPILQSVDPWKASTSCIFFRLCYYPGGR